MPDVWELAAIAAKFALYMGVLTAAGTVWAALLFRLNNFRPFTLGFAVLGIVATILAFSLNGAMLTGDAGGMTDPEMLGLLWSTPVGTAVAYRVVGLGLLTFGLFMGRTGLWISAIGGILAVWSFDHVGHIPDRGTLLLNVALTLHLIAVSLWIGILTPLKRLASDTATWPDAADVGHRFGSIALALVPLLIIAGGYMGFELVGTFSALVSSGYGQTLILKVLFVAILLSLSAANKLRFIPRLRAGDPSAAGHLVKSISIEWLVIIAVLLTTAVLTTTLTVPT